MADQKILLYQLKYFFSIGVLLAIALSLREKCPNTEFFFWSVFSRPRTEYQDLLHNSPYTFRIGENTENTFHAVILNLLLLKFEKRFRKSYQQENLTSLSRTKERTLAQSVLMFLLGFLLFVLLEQVLQENNNETSENIIRQAKSSTQSTMKHTVKYTIKTIQNQQFIVNSD